MKLLVIGHHFVVRENQRLIDELKNQNPDWHITLLTPRWWHENTKKTPLERTKSPDYTIVSGTTCFTGHNTFSFYLTKLWQLLSKTRADVIEVYEEPWSLTLFQVVILKKLLGLKGKIICYSAQNIYKKFPFPFNWIEQFNLKSVAAIHICSNEIENILRKKRYKGIIKKIPLAVDVSKFIYKPNRQENNPLKIGFVGRIVKSKGIFDLILAVSTIENTELHIAGSGPDEHRLKQTAPPSKIHLHGPLNLKQLIAFYHSIDVLVVPSKTTKNWKEQFGRIIIEAFATGASIIGSDSGSIPEIIGSYGLIFKEGNVSDLTKNIKRFIQNRKHWESQKIKARAEVEILYTWQALAAQYIKLFQEVADDSRH